MELAEIVEAFPKTFRGFDGQIRPRVGVVVIDLGGHPDEVVRVIAARLEDVFTADPDAASGRIRVVTFARTTAELEAVDAAVREATLSEYWTGFVAAPELARTAWAEPVALVLADGGPDCASWRDALEDGGVFWTERPETRQQRRARERGTE